MRKIYWQDLSSVELDRLIDTDPIVIIPVGSVEQHGPHLPVGVDSIIATEIAYRVACRISTSYSMIVTPTIWAGLAEHHMGHGGTLTLSLDTFMANIGDICYSLDRRGVRRIVLLNGHGGNSAALVALSDKLGSRLSAIVASVTYFELAAKQMGKLLDHQDSLEHACEVETSIMLAIRPDLVDMDALKSIDLTPRPAPEGRLYRWRPISHWSEHGVLGYPQAATAEKGAAILTCAVEECAEAITAPGLWASDNS